MAQNFSNLTPNAYLTEVAPLQGVQFAIEARMPSERVKELLQMADNEPCLVLYRTTRSKDQIATLVTLWYPASHYQLTGGF